MKIILGKTAGPCFGVKNAVDKAYEELKEDETIYCLGELVHNDETTKELEKNGMIFVDNIEDAKGKVIIRAHGESKTTYESADKMGLDLIDLTCPKVSKIHEIADKYTQEGYFIIITGKTNHPEVIGIAGFCDKNYLIIENMEDLEKIKNLKQDKVLLISQTTFSKEKFERIANLIKSNNKFEEFEIINTICAATKLRQDETMEIAKQVDAMIIIGGKHSSNTTKLYDIAVKYCDTFFIETPNELKLDNIKKYEKIGVMAGASTPEKSIKKVIEMLQKIC